MSNFISSNIQHTKMYEIQLILAFIVTVLIIFTIIARGCVPEYRNTLQSNTPFHDLKLRQYSELDNPYVNPYQGLNYSWGRQQASLGYGPIVIPYADTARYTGQSSYQLPF